MGRWIVVNDRSGQCRRDVGMAINFDFNDITHTLPQSGHFAVVLEEDKRYSGYHIWPATWRTIGFPLFVKVPLIPYLRDVGECAAIVDASLQEQCRQLNTYLASLESIAAGEDQSHLSHALELCDQLAPEKVAALCEKNVKDLSALDAARQAHDAAVRFARERDSGTNNVPLVSIDELFPEVVSGIPRRDWDITENGVGTGRAGYSATYARNSRPKFSASLSVHEFRDEQQAHDGLKELCPDFAKVQPRSASEEQRSQEYILRRTKPQAACWVSGNRIVQIEFLSGGDNDFVGAFLQRFAPR